MAKPTNLPPNSFYLRQDAKEIEAKVGELIKSGLNGGQIVQSLGITRSQLQIIKKNTGWTIARNANRSAALGNTRSCKEHIVHCAAPGCGKPKTVKDWQYRSRANFYCDEICQHRGLALYKGEASGRWIEPKTLICEGCGISYDEPKNVKAGRTSKFHNRTCYIKHAKSLVGNKHPRYVGQGKYRGLDWAEQRRRAAERDNGVCQFCNKDVGINTIDVHHIRAAKLFNGNYTAANALSNLVSLCRPCHAEMEGRTDDGDINTWKQCYEANKGFPRGMGGDVVRELKTLVLLDWEAGMTKAAIARKHMIPRFLVYTCINGPRPRRLTK